ncbi:zinc ribbon domain-containing protein [Anaerovorax odorimutans]|uniref:zinc ribbon domain-containing protein n=1 Tax=Anaerovorax odorimutans TaxID=109327 RepID=UPI0003F5E134|nr:zinc ribbon domain-containing protein [Anaerovorax odorimutans]
MYCKKCNNLLDDTDQFCKICGLKVTREKLDTEDTDSEEEISVNPSYNKFENEDNIIEEPDKEDELQKQNIEKEESSLPKEEADGAVEKIRPEDEFSWNIYDFPKPKKTEAIDFKWGPDPYENIRAKKIEPENKENESNNDFLFFVDENENSKDKYDIEKDSTKEINGIYNDIHIKDTEEKNRKVEETELLSSEENDTNLINNEAKSSKDTIKIEKELIKKEIKAHNDISEIKMHKDKNIFFNNQKEELKNINENEFFTFNKKNEEFQKLLDKEYERIRKNSEHRYKEHNSNILASNTIENINYETFNISPDILNENESINNNTNNKIKDSKKEMIEEDLDSSDIEFKLHNFDNESLEEMKMARENFFRSFETEETKETEELLEVNKTVKDNINKTTDEILVKEENEKKKNEILNNEINDKKADNENSETVINKENEPGNLSGNTIKNNIETEETEKSKKGNIFLKILLVIIILILILEISFLGIKFIAPNSKASKFITEKELKVVQFISDLGNNTKNETDNKTNEEDDSQINNEGNTTKQDSESELDSSPEADKSVLIENQKDKNQNILEVKANDSLKYISGTDYGLSDINNSKPIENNIWMKSENGKDLYYDNEIVGTLIQFDSKWVDYLNNANNEVFELIKSGSQAEENARTFSKVGKVKETFNLLEIGEIRKGENGYYTWCHEEIEIQENGNLNSKSYNWIYHLEVVGDKIQIVNYYKF